MDRPILTPEALVAHDRYVRALAKALVFDPSLAEDVAQETWLAALANAPRDRSSLRAWLATIARNLAFKTWRGQERRTRREIAAARQDAVPSAEEIFQRETVRRSLVEAVFALEDPYRSALVLRYFEDLPPREVAHRLGVPVETARTRIKRGLEMLRARLDREHGSDRSAWCVALVRGMRLEPPSWIPPAAGGLKPVVVGGLVMAASNKLAAGVAVIAICLLLFFASNQNRSGSSATQATAAEIVLAPTAGEETPAIPAALEGSETSARVPSVPAVSEPVASNDPYGSLRVHVEWADGRSAPDILAKVLPLGDDDYVFRELNARTGDDGSFFLEKVHEGEVYVTLDRWVTATTRVERGQETRLTTRIEPGFEVEGSVEDIDGVPIADAELWLTQLSYLDTGFPVARSGADGRFRVRDVQKRGNGMWMTAIAPGYAPSSAGKVFAGVGANVKIRLVLPGPGGELRGTVLGPDGDPIAGAQVRVNLPTRTVNFRRGSRDGTEWEPSESGVVRTDATGAFRASSLPLCDAQIYVKAKSLVTWLGTVEIRSDHVESVTIRLEEGASLAGTVTDSSGKPAVKAEVRATPEQVWREQVTRSAADGSYLLRGIPPGNCTVRAGTELGGMTTTSLVFSDRDALRWDAALPPSPDGSIRGRVVDEQGRPLIGWRVVASSVQSAFYGVIADTAPRTDSDGRFRIEGLAKARYCVAVAGPEKRTSLFPDATVQEVVPGPNEVLVRVTPETRPTAFIRGRIVDPQGTPVESARITLFPLGHDILSMRGIEEVSAVGTGEFHLGPYLAGRWQLKMEAFGYPVSWTGVRELRPGQELDLGTIQLVQGGSIVIKLRREDGTEVGHPFLSLSVGATWQSIQSPEIEGESVLIGPLPPGPYRLAVIGGREDLAAVDLTANEVLPFEIRAGETVTSELVLRSGVPIVVRFRSPDPAPPKSRVTFSLFDAGGREILRTGATLDGSGARELKIGCLVRGHYRIEAERQDGPRTTAEFDVGQSDRVPETHEFELLPP